MNKLICYLPSQHDEEHHIIANSLKKLLEENSNVGIYIPNKSILCECSSFGNALQELGMDVKSVIKSLSKQDPFTMGWNGKNVTLQRTVYKGQWDSFCGSIFSDKTLFCPYLSKDDMEVVLSKCDQWHIEVLAICEKNESNKILIEKFDETEEFK